MRLLHVCRWVRGAWLGLLLACLGFSFALATSTSPTVGGVGGRAGIDTNGSRPMAAFVTDSDLGLVVVGTQFTRQIIVVQGFKPHRFFFGQQKPNSALSLSDSGTLSGTKTDTGMESFDIRVEDQINGQDTVALTKTFFVTGVEYLQDPTLALQFVQAPKADTVTALPEAVANEPYSFTLHVNGGQPPYVFTFLEDKDAKALPLGLSLNGDKGLIMGKPIAPTLDGQPATFWLLLTDSIGTTVKRQFSLTVLPGTISSEFVATSGSFALNFGRETPSDTLKLSVILNKTELARNNIRTAADLSGIPFAMSFGGVSLPPTVSTGGTSTFDKSGIIRFPNVLLGLTAPKGSLVSYQIKLNPRNGLLTASFTGLDMIKTLGANFNSFGQPRGGLTTPGVVVPVNISIGTPASSSSTGGTTTTTTATANFDKTDIVFFDYVRRGAVGKGNARNNDKRAPAGLFLVTKVQGKEVQAGTKVPSANSGDRLFLRLTGILRTAGGKAIAFGTADDVTVLFGSSCLGRFPASSLKAEGDKLQFVNQENPTIVENLIVSGAPLFNFVIDNKKGTFYIDTHGIPPGLLFGQDILVAGEPLVMPVTLTVAAPGATKVGFDGQSSVTLFRKGNTIKNK